MRERWCLLKPCRRFLLPSTVNVRYQQVSVSKGCMFPTLYRENHIPFINQLIAHQNALPAAFSQPRRIQFITSCANPRTHSQLEIRHHNTPPAHCHTLPFTMFGNHNLSTTAMFMDKELPRQLWRRGTIFHRASSASHNQQPLQRTTQLGSLQQSTIHVQ